MPVESRYFINGIDSDSEDRLLPMEKYRYAFMIVPGDNLGTKGVAYVEIGNEKVSYNLPEGDNKCVASCEYERKSTIIYLVANSNGNHSVLEYDPSSNVINEIIAYSPFISETRFLGFDINTKISSINIFDSYITWTDGITSPVGFDIESARGFTLGLNSTSEQFVFDVNFGAGTESYQRQFISALKRPPLYPPEVTYGTDANLGTNYHRGNLYQFMYRYVYYDNSRSTFSPISKVPLPQGEESLLGFLPKSETLNNYLDIDIDTGHSSVVAVEIAFRTGNTGEWYLIEKSIKKVDRNNSKILPDDSSYTFRWYGGDLGFAVPDSETTLNYSHVPALAKVQEVANDNTLFYANYKQGRDAVDLNVSVETTWNEVTYEENVTYLVLDADKDTLTLPLVSELEEGSIISLTVQGAYENTFDESLSPPYWFFSKNITYVVTASDLATYPGNLATSLANLIVGLLGSDYAVVTSGSDLTLTYVGALSPFFVRFEKATAYSPIQEKKKSLKKGAIHNYGIVYFDEDGRHGSVNRNDDLSAYVNWYSEEKPGLGIEYWDVQQTIVINHQAPSWAKSYQIVYGGSNISKFISGVGEVSQVPLEVDGNSNTPSEDKTAINVGGFTSTLINNPGDNYQFEEGDRIRIITDKNENILTTYEEGEVLGYDTAKQQLIISNLNELGTVTTGYVRFEIIRRNQDLQSIVYREIGEAYPVVESGGLYLHGGNVTSQTSSAPARVLLDFGDCYLYPKKQDVNFWVNNSLNIPDSNMSSKKVQQVLKFDVPFDHQNFSAFYESDVTDIGRFHVYNENEREQWFVNRFIYGGKYFEGSNTNKLFIFDPNNENTVGIENGEIIRMAQVCFTLKIIQSRKITSVYLNRQLAVNPGGTDGIILSDKYVGEKREAVSSWGSQHPNSVIKIDRYLFMWDVEHQSIIRDDANGPDDITSQDFKTDCIRLSEKYKGGEIVSGYDNQTGLLFFLLRKGDEIECVSYNIKRGHFNSFHPHSAELYGMNRNIMVSFKNGELWRHNSGTVGNFYGVQFKPKVRVVFNENPKNLKTYQAISIHSNKKWYAPNKGDIKTEDTDEFGVLETRIVSNRVTQQDRAWVSSIPRDLNSNASNPILNGRKLRGNILDVTLECDANEETKIFGIDINYTNNVDT